MTSILTVDPHLMRRVDTRNTENLYSMWQVFSRCAGSLEEGRRLENLSWRLWNRETFCCAPVEDNATTPPISISNRTSDGRSTTEVPDLSASVDSLADEEAIESESEDSASISAPLEISRPRIQRQDSSTSRSRGRERHITPDDLEKMVLAIKEKKEIEPLDIGTHTYLAPLPKTIPEENPTPTPTPTILQVKPASPSSDNSNESAVSQTSATSDRSSTSVVRGFSPSQISSSYRSIPLLNDPSPIPTSALATSSRIPSTRKHTVFALGGSSQSGDDSFNETSSIEARVQQMKKKANNVFTLGGSSGEDESSLRENMQPPVTHRSSLTEALRRPPKKQTSFKEEVATRTIHEDRVMDDDVFESDEDDVDESAIDDDDSSDWEDSVEESGKSSVEEKLSFPRVDSRPNLTSRRSLITTMLHQNDRAAALANAASRSTPAMQRSRTSSPNGPSVAASPDSDDALMMKKGLRAPQGIPRSEAQPIITTTTNGVPHQPALSPKTTRRQMLATELTASLRRHLLWERQQKNQTASAVLKRRHTSQDVANLKQYPEKVHLGNEDLENHGSWNQYFGQGLGEYHYKGW